MISGGIEVKVVVTNILIYVNTKILKVGLSPSKKICFIWFNGSSLKMMENAFYFILKAFLVFKNIGFIEKTAWLEE